jgi:hypothetical protein
MVVEKENDMVRLAFGGPVVALGILTGVAAMAAPSQSVRATQLTGKVWSDFEKGKAKDLTVEFRQGDRLPVTLQAKGDMIETSESAASYVVVKRPFWVRLEQDGIQVSLDGSTYKPFKDAVGGNLTVGASTDGAEGGAANAINVVLDAVLK